MTQGAGTGLRVGVLISGEGSNLQALLDQVHGRDGVEVTCVAANRDEARGLGRARRAGVVTAVFPRSDYPDRPARDAAMAAFLGEHDVELVVLAGFMELLSASFVRRFEGRLLNVHPSLLPAFPGVRALEQALEYGVRVTGVTVHLVDEGVDTGPILLQEAFALPYAAEITEVERRVHEVEHRLLPEAVRLFARGAVHIDPAHPRRVLVEEDRVGH